MAVAGRFVDGADGSAPKFGPFGRDYRSGRDDYPMSDIAPECRCMRAAIAGEIE